MSCVTIYSFCSHFKFVEKNKNLVVFTVAQLYNKIRNTFFCTIFNSRNLSKFNDSNEITGTEIIGSSGTVTVI